MAMPLLFSCELLNEFRPFESDPRSLEYPLQADVCWSQGTLPSSNMLQHKLYNGDPETTIIR